MTERNSEQIITFRPYMAAILSRLHNEKTLVSVQIDKDHNSYNSIILDVDPAHAHFSLDELNPRTGHQKLRHGSQVHIEARLKGVHVQFDASISFIDNTGAIAMYQLQLPVSMIYRQRRRHHRAQLSDQSMPISMPLPLQQYIRGELVDISASGVCSRIDISDASQLEEEQAIRSATIRLPGMHPITCDLEVRSIRRFPEQGYTLVGSEFIDIPPATQSHVSRLVAMLDRHQRRTI